MLYRSLHAKLTDHNTVLNTRDEEYSRIQRALLQNGGKLGGITDPKVLLGCAGASSGDSSYSHHPK